MWVSCSCSTWWTCKVRGIFYRTITWTTCHPYSRWTKRRSSWWTRWCWRWCPIYSCDYCRIEISCISQYIYRPITDILSIVCFRCKCRTCISDKCARIITGSARRSCRHRQCSITCTCGDGLACRWTRIWLCDSNRRWCPIYSCDYCWIEISCISICIYRPITDILSIVCFRCKCRTCISDKCARIITGSARRSCRHRQCSITCTCGDGLACRWTRIWLRDSDCRWCIV